MADNVGYTPGVGATVAADDVGGVLYQRIKLDAGADGASTPIVAGRQPAASSIPVVLSDEDNAGRSADYYPGYGRADEGGGPPAIGPDGETITRTVTDEGTFRANFDNSSLAVSIGTATFTNGSASVACSLASNLDIHKGCYIKLDADAESAWAQVDSIDSSAAITLTAPYTGTGGTGAASRSNMAPFTGSGGTAPSVASGQCSFGSGTTTSARTGIKRFVDYAPLIARARVQVSQRIANQSILIGIREDANPPRWFAWFDLNGTTNTTVDCVTGRNSTGSPSASERQTTTVTLPDNVTTATMQDYRVEMLTESVRFLVNGKLVAEHVIVMPSQHDEMAIVVETLNGGSSPASSTTVTVDYATGKNHNKLEVGIMSDLEKIIASNPPDVAYSYSVAGVITINTDLLIIDMAQLKTAHLQIVSMGTTGVVTFYFTNDLTQTGNASTGYPVAGGVAVTTANAAGAWDIPKRGRYLRIRLTTATTAGTTTLALVASSAQFVPPISSITVTATNLSTNVAQIAGATPLNPATNGSTNRATVAGLAGPTTNTDYSAQAWAAASGSGAVIAQANGLGVSTAFDVNVTAWTAGASTGLDIYLQESPDNGTTYYDIWQCEAITAVSRARIPAIPVGGRRRMRWVNRGGAATTATVTVTAMETSGVTVKQGQVFDRTASVTSGTASVANGASFNIDGLSNRTFVISTGTATAPASWKVQMSMNGTDWYDASAATSCPASSITVIPLTAGVHGRFARFACTVAGTTALVNYGSFYGIQ